MSNTKASMLANVVARVKDVQSGRCVSSYQRLLTSLRGLAAGADKQALALAWIGNEVGKTRTLIAETKYLDAMLVRDNTSFSMSELARQLQPIRIRTIRETVRDLLYRVGFTKNSEIKAISFVTYPEDGVGNGRGWVRYTLLKSGSLIVLANADVVRWFQITSDKSFRFAGAVSQMDGNTAVLANGGTEDEDATALLQRMLGYLVYANHASVYDVIEGMAPQPDTPKNNAGSCVGKRYKPAGTGRWMPAHYRTAHMRTMRDGSVRQVGAVWVNGHGVLLRDPMRGLLKTKGVVSTELNY